MPSAICSLGDPRYQFWKRYVLHTPLQILLADIHSVKSTSIETAIYHISVVLLKVTTHVWCQMRGYWLFSVGKTLFIRTLGCYFWGHSELYLYVQNQSVVCWSKEGWKTEIQKTKYSLYSTEATASDPEKFGFEKVTFYLHGLTLTPAWISNHTYSKVWDEITYPSPNFKRTAVEVW